MIISADRSRRNLGELYKPTIPVRFVHHEATNKQDTSVLANGVILVIIPLKSPIFHLIPGSSFKFDSECGVSHRMYTPEERVLRLVNQKSKT